jgi:hypothetical protein
VPGDPNAVVLAAAIAILICLALAAAAVQARLIACTSAFARPVPREIAIALSERGRKL